MRGRSVEVISRSLQPAVIRLSPLTRQNGRAADIICADAMGRAARAWHLRRCSTATDGAPPMSQQHCHFDASRSLTALEQDSTIIAVIEMSQSKWLVAALVPGVERQPLKKLDAQEEELLKLLHRWRNEAGQAGREIKRIVVAYEAGRDGFWLARWLQARAVEVYVIHPTSIAGAREHR